MTTVDPATGTAGPAMPDATSRSRRRLSPTGSFWAMTLAYFGLMVAAGAPSPIYPIYQQHWQFATSTLTEIFAVYAVALLIALLTVGGLSDFIGRRPVVVAAMVLFAADMVVFAVADGVAWLFAARILQGVAAGLSIGALSAGMIDLAPPGRIRFAAVLSALLPAIGLATGAVVAGAFVRWLPHPTQLLFWILTGVFVLLAGAVLAIRETGARRPGALRSLAPRVRIPVHARSTFLRLVPAMVFPWAQLASRCR
ncbi:MFS transporter [Nakamurella leprariae]|uniref:MFS transporter n=1 Tax=Nakamurella leprariae TaxID=2803911 RepID=A0A938YIK9_9ACTN|nr:MFS transporter [Nakamurella leprariae]MBM9468513.1 MFS transporter [Nakamurella leprariae]